MAKYLETLAAPNQAEPYQIRDKEAARKTDLDSLQPKGDYALKNDLANFFLKSETYSREEVQQLLSTIPKFTVQVVDSLPTENISDSTVYLLASGDEENLYTEYIHVNGAWEVLGSQHMAIVQPDWNQNDWTAPDYVKNRPICEVSLNGTLCEDMSFAGINKYNVSVGQWKKCGDVYPDTAHVVNSLSGVRGAIIGYGERGVYFEMSSDAKYAYGYQTDYKGEYEIHYLIVLEANISVEEDDETLVFAETGFYTNMSVETSYPVIYNYNGPKPLNEKFIPDTIIKRVQTLCLYYTISNGDYAFVAHGKTNEYGLPREVTHDDFKEAYTNRAAIVLYGVQGYFRTFGSDAYCIIFFDDGTYNNGVSRWRMYKYLADGTVEKTVIDEKMQHNVFMRSSTEGSSKIFKLTVDDSGVVTATEVAE